MSFWYGKISLLWMVWYIMTYPMISFCDNYILDRPAPHMSHIGIICDISCLNFLQKNLLYFDQKLDIILSWKILQRNSFPCLDWPPHPHWFDQFLWHPFCLFRSDNDNGNDEDDDNDEMKNVINSPLVFSIPDLFL